MENQACPCCSALPYRDCCLPPHLGRPAADALALMRSRYAAYVLQGISNKMEAKNPCKSYSIRL